MAARSIKRSLRNGALLAGVPLLLIAIVPFINGGVHFVWSDIGEGGIEAIAVPLGGLAMVLAAILPGLPRLVRALLVLGGVAIPIAIYGGTGYLEYQFDQVPGGDAAFDMEEWRAYYLLGCFLLTPITEFMAQGKKTSAGFTLIGLIGWAVFVGNFVLPIGGVVPVMGMVEVVGNLDALGTGGIIGLVVALMLLITGVGGLIFTLLRLFKSPEDRLKGYYRSGSAGVFIAGFAGLSVFVAGAIVAITLGTFTDLTEVFHWAAPVWGLILGAAVGVAHLFLGFFPDEATVKSTGSHGQVYQPAAAPAPAAPSFHPQQPQPAPQQPQPAPQQPQPAAQQQGWPQPQNQPQANVGQRYGQAPQQPAFPQKAPAAPKPRLEAYPGYPGYFMCPKCRGGVKQGTPQCTHCGSAIQW